MAGSRHSLAILYELYDTYNMTEKTSASEVRPGQIWADNDKRVEGRTLRVEQIDGDKVVCTILTNSTDTQAHLDSGGVWMRDMRGKTTRISLSRFKPTATGYRLVEDET